MALCRGKDGDGMRLLLNKDIWHLSGRGKLGGTGMGWVVEIGAVGGGGL